MADSPLNSALRSFEATESNLAKAEKVLAEIEAAIPSGIQFGGALDYENRCRQFDALLSSLPMIDGWKPQATPMEWDEIARIRLDAREADTPEDVVAVERMIHEPSRLLREYRFRFDQKRRQMVRDAVFELMDGIHEELDQLSALLSEVPGKVITGNDGFERLREDVLQVETLLGTSVIRPLRWGDLKRHLHFGTVGDLRDIINFDWPSVSAGLRGSMYGQDEPIPVEVEDLGVLAKTRPRGPVATKLEWGNLGDEDFERLVFMLISSESGYENPRWLMKTNAPDRGRDLSVDRVRTDPLSGSQRQRVIIQCRHWQNKSVGVAEIATLSDQMHLWEPPRVDVQIIATSGRFTADAVSLVEKKNNSDLALRVEMWPESHLELLLATRPGIIAEFSLR